MLTVDDYGRIRCAHRSGMSIREIARKYHHSRRKIRHALAESEPRPYTRRRAPPAPKLDPYKPFIDAILERDKDPVTPRKQRHTAMQIYRRLRAEQDYPGAYDSVRRYVRQKRRLERETFIPLEHEPGGRVECDFGHIGIDLPTGRRRVPVLVMTWSYSGFPFAIALPNERVESILHGMVEGLEFFGCVPREVWWDNPKTVVTEIRGGRERQAGRLSYWLAVGGRGGRLGGPAGWQKG